MAEGLESRLDAIMNALATLSHRTAEIEGVMAGLHNDGASGVAQSKFHQPQVTALEEAAAPLIRQEPMTQQQKEPELVSQTSSTVRALSSEVLSIRLD